MNPPTARRAAALALAALAALTSACAGPPVAPLAPAATAVPAQWHAPLPHDGRLADLARWWQQFDDPLLSALVEDAQRVSPTLADARARIADARAARVAAGAALGPTLDAGASAARGRFDLGAPTATTASAALQAGWELDLFGGRRAAADAAQARVEGAQARWHDARVSVAAELASNYLQLRACEAQREQTRLDAESRAETARLTGLAARAGLQSPAADELARASAAQGRAQLAQQALACEQLLKGLVALTGRAEPELRAQLAERRATLPQPATIAVAAVPADGLAQRPDLRAAERELLAAAADVTEADAQRLPRITLAGSVGPARLSSGGQTLSGTTWSVGPVSVTLPLFDGGARRANAEAARARVDAASVRYAATLREAVREVESALAALAGTEARRADAQAALAGFEASLKAVDARYRGGLASLFELEDARRSAVASRSALIELERERTAAWIALYRALGGGWRADASTPA